MANRSWTRIYLNKIPERSFWIGLLIATLYLSYRYPLQINSSTTSPVYADTPTSLQVGKFILIFLTCCVSAPFLFFRRLSRFQLGIIVLTIAIFCYPLLKMLDTFDSRYMDVSFWPLAALILVIPLKRIDLRAIDNYLKLVLWLTFVSNLVEVGLFVFYGRLPALAFSGSLSVRFGGFLDDPNGFAAIIFLLMGWAFFRFRGKTRFFIQLALVVCVMITESLTAIGFLGALIVFVACWQLLRKPLSIMWIGLLSGFILVIMKITDAFEIINLIIRLKADSATDHLSIPWSSLIDGWIGWIFLGKTSYEFYESWWVSSLISFGALWYVGNLVLTLVLGHSVWRTFRSYPPGKEKSVLAGILLLGIYVVVGSANLPFFAIFPINFLFYLFCFLIVFQEASERKMRRETSPSLAFG